MTEDDLDLEAARKIFAGPCDFVRGVADLGQLPPADRAEIAFAGRSNVGKSSLVNALTGRKTLAKTSNTPGRTQQLNFFDLGGRCYLVDMPGYGYARVARSQKKEWDALMRDYLRGRPTLRTCFVLVDSRHGLKDSDEEMLSMLDVAGVATRLVLTKSDKISKAEREVVAQQCEAALKKHPAAFPSVLLTSAEKGEGIDVLRAVILACASG